MGLKKRIIKVKLAMPNGDVELNESLMLDIKIDKTIVAVRNKATIDVGGLNRNTREFLLSNFNAYNTRVISETPQGASANQFIDIEIFAGYEIDGKQFISRRYKGQVTTCEPVSGPPDIVLRITAYTRQIDTTRFLAAYPPSPIMLYDYFQWAANQMELGRLEIDPDIPNKQISNAARVNITVASLIWEIQSLNRVDIAAFIDDDTLVVKRKASILKSSPITEIDNFIGTPTWNEYGVEFNIMYNDNINLAGGVRLKSILNPSLNTTTFVVTTLSYKLTSRDSPFMISATASPAA